MKVLFVTPYYKPYLGGIERVIEKLGAEFLNHEKISRVGVLTTKWVFPNNPREPREYREDLPDHEIINGLQVYRIGSFPKTAPPFYQVPLVWFSPLEIRHAINKFNPDVIQLMSDRWFWGNFWAWVWGHNRQVAFSLSFHQLDYGRQTRLPLWILKQFLRPINAFLTRRVSWVHAITKHERGLVQNTYWTPQEKFRIIPWGVDVSTQSTVHSAQLGKNQDKAKILAVGRVSEHKGQFWLAERFLEAKLEKPAELVLVGKAEDGEYVGRIRNQESRIKNQNQNPALWRGKKITITGEVSDDELTYHYQTADLFALFPEYEAFGLVFLEAMSFYLPVLTHNVGAVQEVLKEGAVITPTYHQTAATKQLERLVNEDDYRSHLGKNAYKYVTENFSWQKTANKFIRQYQN